MRLGILTILLATILAADAQIAVQMKIATTNNQVAFSYASVVTALGTFQVATNLASPTPWICGPTNWQVFTGASVFTPTFPQEFIRIVQSVPVFEMAVYYNLDLEINPGSALTINGPVHGNANIYATGNSTSTPLTFANVVEAAQQMNLFPSPLDPFNAGRNGNVAFSLTNNNPIDHAGMLCPGLGATTNPAASLRLPPAGTAPASSAGQVYLYNEADIIVSNSASAIFSVYYQNLNSAPAQTLVPMDTTNIIGHTTNIFYSFVTNVAFYDYREAKTVKAAQFDVSKFNTWLTASPSGQTFNSRNLTGSTSKGHGINLVYFYNSIANVSGQLPAVRMVNGAQLPSAGLTVATPFPLYVLGNYNITINGTTFSTTLGDTTNTYPAALMGDAITVLSANWSDTNAANTPLSSRVSVSTTINAATLQGIVPSNGLNYSGGLENVLRLLENWGGTTLTYNGSFAVLFQSQYATSPWIGTGTVYNRPTRAWGWDLNFLQLGRLPPGTPMVVNQAGL